MIIDWSTGWWLGRYKHLRTSVAAEQIVVLLLNVIAFQFESFVSPRFQRNRVSHFHVGRSQMAIESVRQTERQQTTNHTVREDGLFWKSESKVGCSGQTMWRLLVGVNACFCLRQPAVPVRSTWPRRSRDSRVIRSRSIFLSSSFPLTIAHFQIIIT